jgi:hypothetical protein
MLPASASSRAAPEGHAVQLQQRGSLSLDERGDLFLAGLDLAVDAVQLGDQLGGEPAPGRADDVSRPCAGEQRAGLGRRQELLGATRYQLEQQPEDPVEGLVRARPSSSRRPASMPSTTRSGLTSA